MVYSLSRMLFTGYQRAGGVGGSRKSPKPRCAKYMPQVAQTPTSRVDAVSGGVELRH